MKVLATLYLRSTGLFIVRLPRVEYDKLREGRDCAGNIPLASLGWPATLLSSLFRSPPGRAIRGLRQRAGLLFWHLVGFSQ